MPVFNNYKTKTYYNDWAIFDTNNDTLYYCIGYYDKVYAYTVDSKKIFEINIPDYIKNFRDNPINMDSTHDYQYLIGFLNTKPKISSLRFDKSRNLIHILIKKEQALTSKHGEVNNQFSAGFYWLVFDTKGKLLKKYNLPSDEYNPIMFFTKTIYILKEMSNMKTKSLLMLLLLISFYGKCNNSENTNDKYAKYFEKVGLGDYDKYKYVFFLLPMVVPVVEANSFILYWKTNGIGNAPLLFQKVTSHF